MTLFLLQRCDLHDTYKELLPIGFSWIRRHRQYKHIWTCVSQILRQVSPRQFTVLLQRIAAGIGISNFPRTFFMVCLNSSSSGSMKKIPHNCLALSSFGLSIAHFCFALRFDASDICFHRSGHTLSGLEVVCFPVKWPFIQPNKSCEIVHASDNSRSSSTFHSSSKCYCNNTSTDVCVVLVTSMYFSGTGNDASLGTHSLTHGST